MDLQTFPSRTEWQRSINDFIDAKLQQLAHTNAVTRILLSGGSTPRDTYARLGQGSLPFEKLALFQADERYVPPTSADLNANMLKSTLLNNNQHFAEVHFFDTSLPQAEAVAVYEQILRNLPKPLFHLSILGVGPDGHTASLFPHSSALHEKTLVASSTTDTFAGRDRLTLTPTALCSSEHILILATGPDKLSIMDRFRANTETVDELPILCVRNHPNVTLMYSEEK